VAHKNAKVVAEAAPPAVAMVDEVVPMDVATQTAAQEEATTATSQAPEATILAKLEEIIKGQQKVQRALNKTQKQIAQIFEVLEGGPATESETEGPETKKRKRSTGEKIPKAPSGFTKPTNLSPNLCDFLGIPHGTMISRTDVTKRLVAYVRDNNLQKESNKRVILLDDKLKALLRVPEGEEITFFNVQKWLAHLYSKEPFPAEA
jgi:upstream activation factor subunit UAF30